jgi:hypothetical protein
MLQYHDGLDVGRRPRSGISHYSHLSKLKKSRLIPVILIANIAVSFGGERSNVRLSLVVLARGHYGSEDTRIFCNSLQRLERYVNDSTRSKHAYAPNLCKS